MTELIRTLTPSIFTFIVGLRKYKSGILSQNPIFNNFLSRTDIYNNSEGKLFVSYKKFIKDCCELAKKTDKKVFGVMNDVTIIL